MSNYTRPVNTGLRSRLDRIGIPSLTFNIMDAAEYRVKGKQDNRKTIYLSKSTVLILLTKMINVRYESFNIDRLNWKNYP